MHLADMPFGHEKLVVGVSIGRDCRDRVGVPASPCSPSLNDMATVYESDVPAIAH